MNEGSHKENEYNLRTHQELSDLFYRNSLTQNIIKIIISQRMREDSINTSLNLRDKTSVDSLNLLINLNHGFDYFLNIIAQYFVGK